MVIQRKTELFFYRFFDWLSAGIAWLIFFVYRRRIVEPEVSISEVLSDEKLSLGLMVIPLGWVILYSIFDKYSDIYRYSRLGTLRRTLLLSLVGCLFLFFTILIDDTTVQYVSFLTPFLVLLGLHYFITSFFRMLLLTWAKFRLKAGKVSYATLVLGTDKAASKLQNDVLSGKNPLGLNFIGFLSEDKSDSQQKLPYLGSLDELDRVLENEKVEEVILAIEAENKDKVYSVLDKLYEHKEVVLVKIIPQLYELLLGKVKLNHVPASGLIEVDQVMMPRHEQVVKRVLDIIAAVVLIVLCLPLYLYVAIRVRLSSSGPLLFKQERIGKNGQPFHILKFRSMYTDAEKAGPQLSSDHDPRITPFGRTIRKWRLDEIPQFFNLLLGDMSLVGPRPERQYFIDKIVGKEPLYKHLLQVRPGITSWGQVEFGYASTVDEMVQRMKYDLRYLENMSVSLDVKILFQTFLILLQGKGK